MITTIDKTQTPEMTVAEPEIALTLDGMLDVFANSLNVQDAKPTMGYGVAYDEEAGG